jgi:hypothetical protein
MLRTVALVLLALPLAVAAGAGFHYRDQLRRAATHRKGGPTTTVPWAPLDPVEPPGLRLAVAGDVGARGHRLDAVAAALAEVDRRAPFDGLLLLGDLAYPSGNPAALDRTVFEPFAPLLRRGVDLHAVLGNHDVSKGHGPDVMARLAMPCRWWAAHLGEVLLVGVDSNDPTDAEQLAWLEETLRAATERWRIVAVHHPPYSSGYQGSNRESRDAFTPLFRRHGVQLVLSGHEHDYQRTVPIDGTTYVVSGAGSARRGTGVADFTAAAFGWLHFVELTVLPDEIVVRAVGTDLGIGDVGIVTASTAAGARP